MNANDPQAGSYSAAALRWCWSPFDELTPAHLYAALRLRARVFVVEQTCAYLDLDDADQRAHHLLGWLDDDGAPLLAAYARVFEPGVKFAEASIGRVITDPRARGYGYGKLLMHEAIERCSALAPASPIRIGAQAHLERFYETFDFRRASKPYDEDGILHIEMLRPEMSPAS